MKITRGKIIIIAIFLGIIAGLLGMVQLTTIETQTFEGQIDVDLASVKMKSLDEQNNVMIIAVDFNVVNKADKTLTILKMDYRLAADGRSLGLGFFSAETVPLSGRPPLFPGTSTTIPSEFRLNYSDDVSDVWDMLSSGNTEGIEWRAEGTAEIESAFTILPVPFEASL